MTPRTFQQVLLQMALLFGLTLTSYALRGTRSHYLKCHQCTDRERSSYCNITATVQECRDPEDVCYTVVTNKNGFLHSSKGCARQRDCIELEDQNSLDCRLGYVLERCVWCCSQTFCNHDKFNYAATITTPASTISDDEECGSQRVRNCVQIFKRTVETTRLNTQRHFGSFCRSIPKIFRCLARALSTCIGWDESSIDKVIDRPLTDLGNECPKLCNRTAGLQCTTDAQNVIVKHLLNSHSVCITLEREIKVFYRCAHYTVNSCDNVIYGAFNRSMTAVNMAIRTVCSQVLLSSGNFSRSFLPYDEDLVKRSTRISNLFPRRRTTRQKVTGEVCMMRDAEDCLKDFATEVMKIRTEGGDYNRICNVLLQETILCAQQKTALCTPDEKQRVEWGIQYVRLLVASDCKTPTQAPICDTTEARLCTIMLLELRDRRGEDFQTVCDNIDNTTRCVMKNIAACMQQEKESLKKLLNEVINSIGDRCGEPIKCPANDTLELIEGDPAKPVDFKILRSPNSICHKKKNCKVFIDVITESGDGPRCRLGDSIPQIAINVNDEPASCSTEISLNNWQLVQRVWLTARVDFKSDGPQVQKVKVILRLVVEGKVLEVRTVCTLQVIVVDRGISALCKSTGDPHITTFDGRYYNNFFEGYFILYKHKDLPFEVQAVHQKCGSVTCNCGVAVRSGDTVFVVDLCRRRKCISPNSVNCRSRVKTRLFYYDRVTPGTRIFSRSGGRRFEVLLPTGMVVKVFAYKDRLDVHIIPSPYDWMKTLGLCGYYDDESKNDLVLANGKEFKGKGSDPGGQPFSFSESWRVSERAHIFSGVAANPYKPAQFCVCKQSAGQADGSPVSSCTPDAPIELCNLDRSNEITEVLPRQPRVEVLLGKLTLQRKRRGVKAKGQKDQETPEIDVDDKFLPPPNPLAKSYFNQEEASRMCDSHFQESAALQECLQIITLDTFSDRAACIEDTRIMGNGSWAQAALESLKEQCVEEVYRNTTFDETRETQKIAEKLLSIMCLHDCFGNGKCVKGVCRCDEPYISEDCSKREGTVPTDTVLENDGLCPKRESNCSRVIVFGNDFVNSDMLTCHFEQVEISHNRVHEVFDSQSGTSAIYIGHQQVICEPPTTDKYYYISVSNDGFHRSSRHIYIAHDKICYHCQTGKYPSCIRKRNSCVIDGLCYAPQEKDPKDNCNVCDPQKTSSEFSKVTDDWDCTNIRGVILMASIVSLLVLTIMILGVVVLIHRRKSGSFKTTPNQVPETAVVPYEENVPLSSRGDNIEVKGRTTEGIATWK